MQRKPECERNVGLMGSRFGLEYMNSRSLSIAYNENPIEQTKTNLKNIDRYSSKYNYQKLF